MAGFFDVIGGLASSGIDKFGNMYKALGDTLGSESTKNTISALGIGASYFGERDKAKALAEQNAVTNSQNKKLLAEQKRVNAANEAMQNNMYGLALEDRARNIRRQEEQEKNMASGFNASGLAGLYGPLVG